MIKNTLLLMSIILFCACDKIIKSENNDQFSFVFITDVHVQPEYNAQAGFRTAVDTINALKPDFVLTGGDNVRDCLRQNYQRADSLYLMFDSIASQLTMPIYNTIGNHEIFGVYEVSGVDPSHEYYGKKLYEDRVAKRYYAYDYKNWHFIVLDGMALTNDRHYYGLVDSTQLAWLKSDLEKCGDRPTAVSIHVPLLSVGQQIMGHPQAAFRPNEIVTNADEVRALLEQYNVKMVLQGHLHILEDVQYNGIHYITGGAVCSKWWHGKRLGMEEGFLNIHVDGEEFSWEYVDYGWNPEYTLAE